MIKDFSRGKPIMKFDIELVGKIGSMALIRQEEHDIDYNVFSRIGRELGPGMIWVSSGAVEIGRLDYIKRTGEELSGSKSDIMTDYSAQGQAILMEEYRRYISSKYSVRQLLVEHTHFNDPEKREHIFQFLMRCVKQNAVPIVNYNDTVSFEENRRWELEQLRNNGLERVVECIDNDETASVIASLVHPKYLLLFTSVDGIYMDPRDPSTLVEKVEGKDADEVIAHIDELQKHCFGSSRPWAGGAKTKLEFIKEPIRQGTTVLIANSRYRISDVITGNCPRTIFQTR
jgi:glutamate 5-kinase